MPNSDDCDPSSLNPTSGCEELSVGCKDQEYENPEVSTSKIPEVSKDTSTILRPHILENGSSHGSENSSLLGDGILLHSSDFHKMLKKQEKIGDQVIFEADEPSKETTTVFPILNAFVSSIGSFSKFMGFGQLSCFPI